MAAVLRTCWILTDGATGNEKQALALARALGCESEVFRLQSRWPWRWLAPRRFVGGDHAFGAVFQARLTQPPALAIGCGRQGALANRLLKVRAGMNCKTVQILDPRIASAHFDLVIAPAHDGLRGENVITPIGSLTDINEAGLAEARQQFSDLASLPHPITVLALGGPTRALRLDRPYFDAIAGILEHWQARDNGSLLVTSSRRSPDWLRAAARLRFRALPGRQWHGPEDGENPYFGFLAYADRIVVTPDSANLLSEACATGCPVFCHRPQPLKGKLDSLYQQLYESDRVRPLQSDCPVWKPEPLRELRWVAAEVARRLGL